MSTEKPQEELKNIRNRAAIDVSEVTFVMGFLTACESIGAEKVCEVFARRAYSENVHEVWAAAQRAAGKEKRVEEPTDE